MCGVTRAVWRQLFQSQAVTTSPQWYAFVVRTGLCGALAAPLHAQCPDGSSPLCARVTARPPAPAANSVAVLYFDNLSRDTVDAFLADGLTEEIIIRLGQVQRLAVKSRFESQRFRGRAATQDPPALGSHR